MEESRIQWQKYPYVKSCRPVSDWLRLVDFRGRDIKTIDAYGRALNAFLLFLEKIGTDVLQVTDEHIHRFIGHMKMSGNVRHLRSGGALRNSTMQQRLTAIRLFYDYALRKNFVAEHPVPRGSIGRGTPKKQGVLAREQRLPWIPSDDEWVRFLQSTGLETLRNKVMVLLAYEGALRRETLIGLEIGDIDYSNRLISIRPEIVKNGRGSIVTYSPATARLLIQHLSELKVMARSKPTSSKALFRSLSDRNCGQPMTVSAWNKIVTAIARRAELPRFSTHTFRHLRLTHMARAGFELYEIAKYAGHSSSETTMTYIHLSGRDIQAKFLKNSLILEKQLAFLVETERGLSTP